jgi:ABC-type transport system involved in multi-copper enzyme maturation permease subunit
MWKRWGLGPVFVYESLLNARRWQVYAVRSVFVLLLLVGVAVVWLRRDYLSGAPGPKPALYQQMAQLGEWFFYTMAGIQVSLILLAAPAAAAGAICMDRARGTLAHMMVTDLSDPEIVLGKLGSRLAPIIGLIACGVPVAALATLLGGVEFGAILGLFVVSVALAVLGCTLALTISVWAAKTHEVLMAVYMFEGLWLLALPIWEGLSARGTFAGPPVWFQMANPFVLVFAPYYQPGFVTAADFMGFAGVLFALSTLLLALMIARLRGVIVSGSGRQQKSARRWRPELKRILPSWPSPTLDGNPVMWREWHRGQPSKLGRSLWALLLLICWLLVAWGTREMMIHGEGQAAHTVTSGYVLMLVFGLLMLSATAPTALAEERVRGSLDVLLTTPLSTRSIVIGKWWGTYRSVLFLTLMPLYVAVFLACSVPDTPVWAANIKFGRPLVPLTVRDRILAVLFSQADFLASCAMIVSLGLALATWVRRIGRAIALSVTAFLVVGLGWIFLVEILFRQFASVQTFGRWEKYGWLRESVSSFSPIAGPMRPTDMLVNVELHERGLIWLGTGVVIVIKAAIALALLWLTIKTFDRCMGRMPESGSRARAPEPGASEGFTTGLTHPAKMFSRTSIVSK